MKVWLIIDTEEGEEFIYKNKSKADIKFSDLTTKYIDVYDIDYEVVTIEEKEII